MSSTCKVEGCDNPIRTKGFCNKHYQQMLKYGEIRHGKYEPNEIIIYEDYAEMLLYNLSGQEVARTLINIEDVSRVKDYHWYIDNYGYVNCKNKNGHYKLHRFVMDCPDDMVVDHINHNPLDNRRENLRVCTNMQNQWNKGITKKNTSGITGVYKEGNGWRARIKVDGKTIQKRVKTKEEAIKLRQEWEDLYFKEFKYKNEGEDNNE